MKNKIHIAYHNFVEKKMSMNAALIDIFSAGYEDGYEAGLTAQAQQEPVDVFAGLELCEFNDECDFCKDPMGGSYARLVRNPMDVTETEFYICGTCARKGKHLAKLVNITAYVNASNSTQLDYKYFVREIGEEDWREVTHSTYEASKPDPRTDYKRVAVVWSSN